jgi:hypothetical protein
MPPPDPLWDNRFPRAGGLPFPVWKPKVVANLKWRGLWTGLMDTQEYAKPAAELPLSEPVTADPAAAAADGLLLALNRID